MRFVAFICSTFLLFTSVQAQVGTTINRGAASLSMAGTYLTLENEYSLFSSPSNLVTIENIAIQASGEQRFLQTGLLNASFGIAKKISALGTVSIHANQFGIDEYKEVDISLGYGRKLDNKINLGISFSYMQLRIEEYGSKSIFNADIGLSTYPIKNLMVVAHIIHPFRTEVAENSRIPLELNLGMKYTVSSKAQLRFEFHKEVDFEEQVIVSLNYTPIDILNLRTGFTTNPGSLAFGIGLKLNDFIILDFGFQTHQYLSPTPGLSALYYKK